jgi:hypothetical protein
MRKLVWLIVGVVLGFTLAHQVNSTARGRAFFEAVGERAQDFRDAVGEGYRIRDSELRFGQRPGR